jgi:hypothetical protein
MENEGKGGCTEEVVYDIYDDALPIHLDVLFPELPALIGSNPHLQPIRPRTAPSSSILIRRKRLPVASFTALSVCGQ